MALVVGYDRHPASRAAVLVAGELGGALKVPVHVVHVIEMSDSLSGVPSSWSFESAEKRLDAERQHVGEALAAAHVQWTYRVLHGDPVAALLGVADEHAATFIVVGRPQRGVGPALGHMVTGTVARKLLRRSTRPVVVVPEFGDSV